LERLKAVIQVTLRTGGRTLTDIAKNGEKPSDVVVKHVGESAQNLIQKLRGRERKRAAPQRITPKKFKLTKRDTS
jgi:hypothetical protein